MTQESKDIFLALRSTLEEDLKSTGFSPDANPPGREPKITGSVAALKAPELKALYDEFLAFYDYITDQIVSDIGFEVVSKARLEHVQSSVTLKAHADSTLKNAEQRKAFVHCDLTYLGAKRDYTYFKGKLAMQQERRDKYKRAMDRIGRELWLRTQDDSPQEFYKPSKRINLAEPAYRSAYKHIKDNG